MQKCSRIRCLLWDFTIYLADAVRQNNGKVISTEILESKANTAIQNLKDVYLDDFVELRVGDAMETLKGMTKSIDFLFLDGWKELYLPLFQMLEPLFHTGTLIYADNMDMTSTKNYAQYLIDKQEKYLTEPCHDGKATLSKCL